MRTEQNMNQISFLTSHVYPLLDGVPVEDRGGVIGVVLLGHHLTHSFSEKGPIVKLLNDRREIFKYLYNAKDY